MGKCQGYFSYIVDGENFLYEVNLLENVHSLTSFCNQLNNFAQTGHQCTKVVLNVVTGVDSLYEVSFRTCTLLALLVLDPTILHKLKTSMSRMLGTCILQMG